MYNFITVQEITILQWKISYIEILLSTNVLDKQDFGSLQPKSHGSNEDGCCLLENFLIFSQIFQIVTSSNF